MKRYTAGPLVAVLALTLALPLSLSGCTPRNTPALGAASDPFTLTLLHSNDTHSYLAGRDAHGNACFKSVGSGESADDTNCVGGMARMATVLKAERAHARKTGGHVLAVDAGDRFQGTLFYTVNKWPMLVEVDKLLSYDAMTLGNHEFDEGCAVTADFVRTHTFPVLAANLTPQPQCPLYGQPFKPYVIGEYARGADIVKVGVVGLANPDVVTLGAACSQTHFVTSKEALEKAVTELKSLGVRHIVAVTHLGLLEDRELARSVEGVDIIVGGHSHSYLGNDAVNSPASVSVSSLASSLASSQTSPLGKGFPKESPEGDYPVVERAPSGQPVLVVTAKFATEYLGKLSITFDEGGVPERWNGAPLPMNARITPDPQVEKLVQSYAANLDTFRSAKVGSHDLSFADGMEACRTSDCLSGMVASDAMLEYARPYGAVAALRNGGGLRAPLKRGELSQGDVLAVLPFPNAVVVREFTGVQLWAALEHGASGEGGISPRLLQVSGLRYRFDAAKPVGARVLSAELVDASGKTMKIDSKKKYVVAVLDYLARGGDGYAMLTKGRVVHAPDALDVDIVSAYITKYSPMPMPKRFGAGRILRK